MRPVDPLHPLPAPNAGGPRRRDRCTTTEFVEVDQLNTTYFHALDGLLGPESDARWARCFTDDGTFTLLDAAGGVVADATGESALTALHRMFPYPLTTRHWCDQHVVEPAGDDLVGRCYIAALNLATRPATISRTGLYQDHLVRQGGRWRYRHRTLTLDPLTLDCETKEHR